MSRRAVLTAEQVRAIREAAALPRGKRPKSLRLLADLFGVSYGAVVRCGRGEQRCYQDTHRVVSRGFDALEESCREKGPQARSRSVASSAGTPGITGVACGSETRYHESKAETRGVTGNAGAAGGGRP